MSETNETHPVLNTPVDPLIGKARAAMEIEADSIRAASMRLDGKFLQAVEALSNHSGKIIISGMGKSGYVAQKLAATFSSTGSPSVFLHPAEAVHGDLGVYTPGDPTILISKSGSTAELVRLIPILREFHSPLIGILGNLNSTLSREVDVVLDASVECEADPLNLAPTASVAVALSLGDALAAALMTRRNFQAQDFARFHPGGQLGRNLLLQVSDVMHGLDHIATVRPDTPLKDVVIEMTRYPLGAACVLDDSQHLDGIITDGDVRRAFQKYDDIRSLRAEQVMISKPVTILPSVPLALAVDKMEKRASQISVLPVVDADNKCLGLIRIHDIYQVDLR
ncbi:MAG: KpsF/GutQ family sugar-phosphate isomerase [Chloroflexota bacterium]